MKRVLLAGLMVLLSSSALGQRTIRPTGATIVEVSWGTLSDRESRRLENRGDLPHTEFSPMQPPWRCQRSQQVTHASNGSITNAAVECWSSPVDREQGTAMGVVIFCHTDPLLGSGPPRSFNLYAQERSVTVTLSCEER